MKVGSLFSGIGGIDLGLERAGMKIVWQVENNPYCQKVLNKHWPGVPCYGDIKEIDFAALPPVDLICGGFPCQPVSCAGKRQGDRDERWLWPEFYRAVCEARPRWVLVENVPGLLSAQDGRLFGGILRDLARGGFDAEWDLLPAAAFGAPHLRYRLFLVAHSRRERLEGIIQGRPKTGSVRRGNRKSTGMGKVSVLRRISLPYPHDAFIRMSVPSHRGMEYRPLFRKGWWAAGPPIFRVAHGIPSRVDRLKCLGNSVVPQVAEWIGRRIMEING